MAESTTMRSQTIVDGIFAAALILLGIFLLVESFIAAAFSTAVIGWVAIIAGVISLIEVLMKHRRRARRVTGVLSGVLLLALGILIVRDPVAATLSLTIVLALVFFVRGIASIAMGFSSPTGRAVIIAGGFISVALGVIVLVNLGSMTQLLLGVLLGLELIVTGFTMIATGRPGRSPRAAIA